MTRVSTRSLLAPAAISASIIVAMKLYVVQPLNNRLKQTTLQAQVIADDSARQGHSDIALDQMRDKQAVVDRRLDEIILAGQIVHDEGLLFKRISDLSAAVNVSLERLDPQPNLRPTGDATEIRSMRCSLEVMGSYGSIAMFVRDLERDLGITVVRSVHITPVLNRRDELVLAIVETEHFSINPRAASIKGGGR